MAVPRSPRREGPRVPWNAWERKQGCPQVLVPQACPPSQHGMMRAVNRVGVEITGCAAAHPFGVVSALFSSGNRKKVVIFKKGVGRKRGSSEFCKCSSDCHHLLLVLLMKSFP